MPRLLILLTLPPDVTEQYRARLTQKFPEICYRRNRDRRQGRLGAARGRHAADVRPDDEEPEARPRHRGQAEMGAGARHRTRRHHRPARAQAGRYGDEPAWRPRRAGVGGGAGFDAGAQPRPAGLRPRPGPASMEALAGEASAREDRRHPRHRRDRRGAGAEMQGDGHDGDRHHLIAAQRCQASTASIR